jgi:hypothetical protein
MTTATLSVTKSAIETALLENPEYKALVIKAQSDAQAKAEAALSGVYVVKSLGNLPMTLPQVAITYQAYKGIPKAFGANARSFTEAISRECLAIIKATGLPADWKGIEALAQQA